MDSLDNIFNNIISLVPKKNRKLINNENLITALYFIVAIYIYQKKPKALVGFLVHPFSQVILLGISIYYLANKNYSTAIGISFIFITSILINKETQVENIKSRPIENREYFSDKQNTDSDDDDDEAEAEEEFDDEEDDEEEFEDDDDEEEEEFTVEKKKNLNDTFKNLHDAIHQLETFITTPN